MKRLRAVEVEWIDSAFNRGWDNQEDKARSMDISTCRSVGYLVKRTKRCLSLAMSAADGSLADGISIPSVAIQRVRRLR